jgi:hypothetical protein
MPDDRERQVIAEAQEIVRTRTEDLTSAAAREGVSYTSMYRKVKRGEVEAFELGTRGELRVWIEA